MQDRHRHRFTSASLDVEVVERQDRTLIRLNSPVLGATHDKSRHRLVLSAYASASASSVPVSVTYL